MSETKYHVTLTEAQVTTISKACELFARCRLGQLYDIVWKVFPDTLGKGTVDHELIRKLFDEITMEIRKQPGHTGSDKDWSDDARAAWDVHQVFRHRMSWDKNPEGNSMNVHFDEPMPISLEPLPQIEGYTHAIKGKSKSEISRETRTQTKRP